MKKDLTLNDLQWLICTKNQTKHTQHQTKSVEWNMIQVEKNFKENIANTQRDENDVKG